MKFSLIEYYHQFIEIFWTETKFYNALIEWPLNEWTF